MYDPVYKQSFTAKDFTAKWGLEPEQWGIVKAMAGCSGDGVEGIPMIGEKTAAKFLKGELRQTTKTFSKIIDADDIVLRNVALVVLPFSGTGQMEVSGDSRVDKHGFVEVCNTHDMPSLLEEIHRWTEAFGME